MDNAIRIAKKIMAVLAAMFIILAVVVLTLAAAFSVITNDDFDYAMQTGRAIGAIGHIAASWHYMTDVYFRWQGTFFSEFLDSFLNPVLAGSFTQLSVIMVINALFAFASFGALIHTLLDMAVRKEYETKIIVMACGLFAVFEYDVFAEVFFWYTGAAVIGFPLSMACLALALMLKGVEKDSKGFMIAASLIGFLAAGGTLAVSGSLCYLALVVIVYYWVKEKKINRKVLIPFISFFSASLVNTLAPGNYVRQVAEGGEGLSIGVAIGNTARVFMGEVDTLFNAYNFGAVLLMLVACGMFFEGHGKVDRKAWYISSVIALIAPFVSAFPVILGYGVPWLPNRCLYVFYLVLVLSFGNAALVVGTIFAKLCGSFKNAASLAAILAAVILALISSFSPYSYRTVRVAKGLYDHVYQNNYRDTKELFDYLNEHKGESVEVDVARTPEEVEYCYSFFLTDDPEDRINRSVAWAFELESIRNMRGQ